MPIRGDGTPEAKLGGCATICAFFIVVFLSSFTVVPVGYVGVLSHFGSLDNDYLPNGWYMLTPFISRVAYMSTRVNVLHFAADVPTSEGVIVHLEASCINQLDADKAVELYRTVGVDFEQKVIQPEFQSIVRTVTSAHSSQALYNAHSRAEMRNSLIQQLKAQLSERGINVVDALVNKLRLPSALEAAIEQKMAVEQQYEQMIYVLEKWRKVRQQLEIQASGLATYQRIVGNGITERVLRWKGIESTKDLSNMDGCPQKLVFIGGNDEKTPMMLPLMLSQFGSDSATESSSMETRATSIGMTGRQEHVTQVRRIHAGVGGS